MSTPPEDSRGSPGGASRRLHAVLLADMTGFSRLMGEDETRAVAALSRIRNVFSMVVPRFGGTLDVLVGDCFVALFESAVDAVQAGIAIQTELAGAPVSAIDDPVRIRIGIHLGDVVRSGSEILGDSVNVAARLQTIAQPGAIAMSEDVHRAVRNRISLPFVDLGPRSLKNIAHKIRVFEIRVGGPAGAGEGRGRPRRRALIAGVAVALVAVVGMLGQRLASRPAPPGVPPTTIPAPSAAPVAPVPAPAAAPSAEHPLMIGVTGVNARGEVPSWMRDTMRDGLNTLLSKVPRLRVFSREKIDFLRERRGLSEIEVAETLGIQKMIVGSLTLDGRDVVLEARVVDIATGILEGSEEVRGETDDLIELQNRLAGGLLATLRVPLSQEERAQVFANRTRDSLDAYRRLADTFGDAPGPAPASPRRKTSWLAWPRAAWAGDAGPEQAIRAVLETYRAALEAESVEAVAATHVELNEEQRAGFERYFAGAEDLKVAVTNLDVLVDGDQALVTFTRRDDFRDRGSGKPMSLEVRLSSVVEQRDGRWLLRGVKRSS